MNQVQSNSLLPDFSRFLEAKMGLHFTPDRMADLQRGVASAAGEFGFSSAPDCIRWLMSGSLTKDQIQILAGHLTVGETYFFREKKVFEALEQQILPELARLRDSEKQLRIWSAACCTGEEAYSIAISVRKTFRNLRDWHVTILGTDINPRFLQKAEEGVFSEWSFRDTPVGFKEAYFDKTSHGRWAIRPKIKAMVRFSQLNLAEDIYPSLLNDTNAVDVIFCRNVLIYFSPTQTQRVIRKLTHCLKIGGWLALGPNETSQATLPDLIPERFSGATLHRKANSELSKVRDAQPPTGANLSKFVSEHSLSPPTPVASSPLKNLQATEKPEQSQRVLYDEALAYYQDGSYAQAAEVLTGASGPDSNDQQRLTLLARALANEGKLTEALAASELLIAGDRLNPIGHYLRATILQEQGNLGESKSALKRALYLDPEFVLAHFTLGNLARSEGKLVESDRHFANAFKLAQAYDPEAILPEAEGLTAGRLAEIITAIGKIKSISVNA
jgi:chemotaxis protein methyltransferase CheR